MIPRNTINKPINLRALSSFNLAVFLGPNGVLKNAPAINKTNKLGSANPFIMTYPKNPDRQIQAPG